MSALLLVSLTLLSVLAVPSSGLTCHVCRSQPPPSAAAAASAAVNSTLGLILTLALHSPPDCQSFSAADRRFQTRCPLGLNSTCAVAEDAAGRHVRTCFGAARGARGCFREPEGGGTFCLCAGDLCNGVPAAGAASLAALLVVSVTAALAVW